MPEIQAPITGNVWKTLVEVGSTFAEFDSVAILESMKLEIPVEAEESGTIVEILVAEGDSVVEGAVMFVFE
jgi:acetyl-CoA carboxylase biotin carboxyl carrier protein